MSGIKAVLITSLLLACAVAPAAQRGRKAVTHTVTIDAASFQPATLSVQAGDSVVWVNKDLMPHTATAPGKTGFDSGTLAAGESWKQVFKTIGKRDYVCVFHPTMKGTLVVE